MLRLVCCKSEIEPSKDRISRLMQLARMLLAQLSDSTCEAIVPQLDVRFVVASVEVPPSRFLGILEGFLAILAGKLGFPHSWLLLSLMMSLWMHPLKYEMICEVSIERCIVFFDCHACDDDTYILEGYVYVPESVILGKK